METTQEHCQSCGMRLGPGFYGTNQNTTISNDYCKYCFENGQFREPNITLEEMIGRSVANMKDEEGVTEEEAVKLATNTIPNLTRWRKG